MKLVSPLIAIAWIAVLSALVTLLLFGILRSTGIFKYGPLELGGAAAGFIGCFWFLFGRYDRLNKTVLERLDLSQVIARIMAGAMIREAERNVDDLNTRYGDTLRDLRSHLGAQDAATREAAEKAFHDESVLSAKVVAEFKDWEPPSADVKPAVGDTASATRE
jgi:hypothetical protein